MAAGAVPVARSSKTTVIGVSILVATLATLVTHALTVGVGVGDISAVMNALAGIGLIHAADQK